VGVGVGMGVGVGDAVGAAVGTEVNAGAAAGVLSEAAGREGEAIVSADMRLAQPNRKIEPERQIAITKIRQKRRMEYSPGIILLMQLHI